MRYEKLVDCARKGIAINNNALFGPRIQHIGLHRMSRQPRRCTGKVMGEVGERGFTRAISSAALENGIEGFLAVGRHEFEDRYVEKGASVQHDGREGIPLDVALPECDNAMTLQPQQESCSTSELKAMRE